jgi:hypothetical protein
MILNLMFLTLFMVVAPIVLGWVFLLAWPVFMVVYVMAYSFFELMQDQLIKKSDQRLRTAEEGWQFLLGQKSFSWGKVGNSLELSCRSREVSTWMKDLGVREPETLWESKTLTHSTAYPDCYDLVTDMLDSKDPQNLNQQYSFAASLMRSGAYFVDQEMNPQEHSLKSHVENAKEHGLRLIARGDLIDPIISNLSIRPWLGALNGYSPIFLIWQK